MTLYECIVGEFHCDSCWKRWVGRWSGGDRSQITCRYCGVLLYPPEPAKPSPPPQVPTPSS